jgi:hypothetical protein
MQEGFPLKSTSGFLSLGHPAQWADVSVRTIKRWIERGLPKYQLQPGSKIFVRTSDLEKFLGKKEVQFIDINKLAQDISREILTLE